MGQTFDLMSQKLEAYYKEYVNEAEQNNHNQPVVLDDNAIDKLLDNAAQRILDEMEAQINASQGGLEDKLKNYWDSMLTGPDKDGKTPKLEGNPDEMQKRDEYSEKCREAILKQLKIIQKRKIQFDNALKRYVGKDELAEGWDPAKSLDPHRFIYNLMKLPGEDNWERDNERLTLITALCEKAITEETFQNRMTRYYVEYNKMSENDARKKAEQESKNPARQLYNILEDAYKKGKRDDKEYIEAASKIQTREVLKEENGLDKAFDTLMQNSTYLGFNGTHEMTVLCGLGLDMKEADANAIGLQWERESSRGSDCADMSTNIANPYWVFGDLFELYEKNVNVASDNRKLPKDEWFNKHTTALSFVVIESVKEPANDMLKRYGMTNGTMNRSDYSEDMVVWKNGDRIRILQQKITMNPTVEVSLRDDIPGKYMDDFLKKGGQNIMDRCNDVTKWYNSSSQFRDMQNALKDVSKFRLGFEAHDKQVDMLLEKLKKLQEATENYILKKETQKAENNNEFKNSYEESRRNFADEVMEFTETAMEMLSNISKHKAVALEAAEAEIDEYVNFEQKKIPDNEKNLSALQRKDKHKEEQEKKEKAERARITKEKIDKETYEQGMKTYNELNEAEKKTSDNKDISDPVDKYLEDRLKAESDYSKSLFDQNDTQNAITAAERTLALVTIREMKKKEKQIITGEPERIDKIITKGGLEDIIKLVKDNNDFKSAFKEDFKVNNKEDLERFMSTDISYKRIGLTILKKLNRASEMMREKNKQNVKAVEKVEVKANDTTIKQAANENKPKEMKSQKGRALGGM